MISVVTPTLHPDVTDLMRCVRSVVSQTGVSVEHVIVDGGSEPAALDGAERSGAKLVIAPGSGQSEAINLGVEASRGNLIAWLGADDTLAPGALIAIADTLANEPRTAWVYGNCAQHYPDHTEVFKPPRVLNERSLEWGNRIAQPGSVIRRSAWEALGGLSAEYGYAMDVDLWARLLTGGYSARYLDRTLATFRIHAHSKSGSADPARFLREEHTVWTRAGWLVPASVTLGRALWHEKGPRAMGVTTADLPRHVDASLVRASARTSAILDAFRRNNFRAALRYLNVELLLQGPCRRRLLRAAINSAAARSGFKSRH